MRLASSCLALVVVIGCGPEATPPPPPPPAPAPAALASAPAPIAPVIPADAGSAAAAEPPAVAVTLDLGPPAGSGTIAVAEFAACALTSKKDVACWGVGSDKETYPADIVRSRTPKVIAGLAGAQRVSAGYRYACAVLAGGEVSCWGMLKSADDTKGGAKPAKIAGLKDVVEVSVGRFEACARKKAGEIWCWGKLESEAPAPVKIVAEAARFDAAGGALCWLTKTGKAECVGGPASGAHGSIPTSDSGKTAMKLPPSTDIAAETGLACTVTGSRTIACDGDRAEVWAPLVADVKGAKRVLISPGVDFGCALTDGKPKCWGQDYAGQLGAGGEATKSNKKKPAVEVPLVDAATDLALGATTACARTTSGKVYCWGDSGAGIIPGAYGATTPKEVVLP